MDSSPVVNGAGPSGKNSSHTPWFYRLSRPVLFLTISMAFVGGYLALSVPISAHRRRRGQRRHAHRPDARYHHAARRRGGK